MLDSFKNRLPKSCDDYSKKMILFMFMKLDLTTCSIFSVQYLKISDMMTLLLKIPERYLVLESTL